MEASAGEAPASPSWPDLLGNEQAFFVKKVVPSWGVEGVELPAEGGGEGDGVMERGDEMEGGGAAVACEAVEFEDLFAKTIAEGANLEFRVSRVTGACGGGGGGGGEGREAMEVDGAVFERLAKSEIVMEDAMGEVVEVRGKEEVVDSDVKVEGSEGAGNLLQSWSGASEEVRLEEESDAAFAMNRLEMQVQLVNSHVEELQRIVNLQCGLTGANPLAQELVRTFSVSLAFLLNVVYVERKSC